MPTPPRPLARAARRATLAMVLVAALVAGPAIGRAQPAPDRTITVALAQEPDRLYAPASVEGQLAANLVFDPLVGLDDHMQSYPVLAAAVPSADNGLVTYSGTGPNRRLVVTMPLRPGVTWSDGDPFTADDVVFTWQLMTNPRAGFDTTAEDRLKAVERVDDLTVRFTYLSANEARASDPERYRDQGDAPVLDPRFAFGLPDAPAIYPRHVLRSLVGDDPRHADAAATLGASDFARNPVGTGPYTLAGWDRGASLTFASRRLDLPHRQGQPAIPTVAFRVIGDRGAAVAALQSGDVQVLAQDLLDGGERPVLDGLPGVQARYVPGSAWEQITFNLDNPVLADAGVRQAIAYAVDRQALNDLVFYGTAQVATSQVPPWSFAFNPDLAGYEPNPARAEALLDRAGWTRPAPDAVRQKNGRPLSLRAWSAPATFRPALLAALKDQLGRVGIDLQAEIVPSAVLFDPSPDAAQALVARQFDLAEFAWVSAYDPGADAVYTLHSTSVPTKANGYRGGNFGDYRNTRVDALLDAAQRSGDPAARAAAFNEAQTIWQSDLPLLPLLLRPVGVAAVAGVQHLRPTPAPAGETWNVEQWDLAPAPSPAPSAP